MQLTEQEIARLAANGDLQALRGCAWHNVQHRPGAWEFERYAMAEVFARLAVQHGQTDDAILLAGILRVRGYHFCEFGDLVRAHQLIAQSDAICDAIPSLHECEALMFLVGVLLTAADDGDDAATILLDKLMAKLPTAARERVRRQVKGIVSEFCAPASPRHDIPSARLPRGFEGVACANSGGSK